MKLLKTLRCSIRGHYWVLDAKQVWKDEGQNERFIVYRRCFYCEKSRRLVDSITARDEEATK